MGFLKFSIQSETLELVPIKISPAAYSITAVVETYLL
jgi:hypothetical protein